MKIMEKILDEISSKFPNCIYDKIYLSKNIHNEINLFIDKNPFLKSNTSYLNFLLTFSGLSYFDENTDEDFTLYGFNSNGIKFTDKDYFQEPFLDSKDYFLFGHLFIPKQNKYYDLVFNTKSELAVFLKENSEKNETSYRFLCESFDELLYKVSRKEIK